jgi:hypothetical protein
MVEIGLGTQLSLYKHRFAPIRDNKKQLFHVLKIEFNAEQVQEIIKQYCIDNNLIKMI